MTSVPDATVQPTPYRYDRVAVALHWITAAVIIVQLYVGFSFGEYPRGSAARDAWFTWHRTLGALILLLALIRLGWRVAHPPPPYPEDMPKWERVVGTWNHRAFYFLIIAIPLTGLAAVSGRGPLTTLIGGIPFPTLNFLGGGAEALGGLHEPLIFLTIALVVLHVGAALKHQFVDKQKAAGRMPPFSASPERSG